MAARTDHLRDGHEPLVLERLKGLHGVAIKFARTVEGQRRDPLDRFSNRRRKTRGHRRIALCTPLGKRQHRARPNGELAHDQKNQSRIASAAQQHHRPLRAQRIADRLRDEFLDLCGVRNARRRETADIDLVAAHTGKNRSPRNRIAERKHRRETDRIHLGASMQQGAKRRLIQRRARKAEQRPKTRCPCIRNYLDRPAHRVHRSCRWPLASVHA